ncbi:IS3 family transposase [Gilliamella apicola]|uniref:IS3 family transposase n=1 Tax=Gilliamella sp. App2-1 TaxID=3120230 RepID=UPI001146E831
MKRTRVNSLNSTTELQRAFSAYAYWYNHKRLHSSLGYLPSVEFKKHLPLNFLFEMCCYFNEINIERLFVLNWSTSEKCNALAGNYTLFLLIMLVVLVMFKKNFKNFLLIVQLTF